MKILVADDSPVLRAAVTKLLEQGGYEVVTAVDGVDAITSFYEVQPDLVLLDVQMPKLTGYVVCRLIKEDPAVSHIPVLILTVRDSEEDRYWGAQSGADGYLTKDALGEGLVAGIRSALATRALTELNRGEMSMQPVLGEADVLTRVCEMLDRKLFEATVVNELTAVGNRSLDVRGSVDEILGGVRRLIAYEIGAFVSIDDLKMLVRLETRASYDEFQNLAAQVARKLRTIADRELEATDLSPVFLGAIEPDEGTGLAANWESFYAVPLRARGQLLGLFVLAGKSGGVFTDSVFRTLRTIEPAIAAVIESAHRYQEALVAEARSSLSSLLG
jgi:DNA-binding response OmpR family regulator